MRVEKYYTLITYTIEPTAKFPNNEFLPVLHYKNVLRLGIMFNGWNVRRLFRKNGWYNAWRSGIYDFDHYHSNTHEVVGVIKGRTTVVLGGEGGQQIIVEKGDVLIIPAGVAHKNVTPKKKCVCIGAYPWGIQYDICDGTLEGSKARENINKVGMPSKDPVFGKGGEIRHYW